MSPTSWWTSAVDASGPVSASVLPMRIGGPEGAADAVPATTASAQASAAMPPTRWRTVVDLIVTSSLWIARARILRRRLVVEPAVVLDPGSLDQAPARSAAL